MSLQKASLMSSLVAVSLSMEDKRLLARVALGEAEMVWFSGAVGSLRFISVVFFPSSESRVLLTASRTTADGLVS